MDTRIAGLLAGFLFSPSILIASGLPVITAQPTNVFNAGTFSVATTGATAYQWRLNGTDIPGATDPVLTRTSADPTGYYMAVVKNEAGWVPSQMAYLSRGSGLVPFSNKTNTGWLAPACYPYFTFPTSAGIPITNGWAQVLAGPELDQMQPTGQWADVRWGFFDSTAQTVQGVAPGQTVYYQIEISNDEPMFGICYTQISTVLKLVAGGPVIPSTANLKFPQWMEWPEPRPTTDHMYNSICPTNQVRALGESITLTNTYMCYGDLGTPTAEWRKDGVPILGATNFAPVQYFEMVRQTTLTLTNIQLSDAGIYDVMVLGNNWIIYPKIRLSVQGASGPGAVAAARIDNTGFQFDFTGAPGRAYEIQASTNLLNWQSLGFVTNTTGTLTFTNTATGTGSRFYRTRLVP